MNLTRKYWPRGWTPSDDDTNGSPEGLLRMDNLCYDENGVLNLARGISKVNTVDFPFSVHSIYSKLFDDTKYRFVGLSNGSVQYSSTNTFAELLADGSTTKASFASALGHVFIHSDTKKKKFDGTNITDITPDRPANAPGVRSVGADFFTFNQDDYSNWDVTVGTRLDTPNWGIPFYTSTELGILDLVQDGPYNTMALSGGAIGGMDDLIRLWVLVGDTDLLQSIRVIFNIGGTNFDELQDYYWYQWDNDPLEAVFNPGVDQWTNLKAKRKDFKRAGQTEGLGWESVKSVRIIFKTYSEMLAQLGTYSPMFLGSNNPLDGFYEYMQVNVNNTGPYIARSLPSDTSLVVDPQNSRVAVQLVQPVEAQVNELWIYRRDALYNSDVRPITEPKRLLQWYRVGIVEEVDGSFPFEWEDTTTDIDALILNETIELGLLSVNDDITDPIIDALAPFQDRMFLMSETEIYITTERDFGLYNPQWTLKVSGNTTEKNLWIRKVAENQILIGTTQDIYSLTGTCTLLPEGFLDLTLTPLGVEYPPTHSAVAIDESNAYYVAKDGVRVLQGNKSQVLSRSLDLLFQGFTRYNTPAIEVKGGNYGTYSLSIAKSKLWFLAKLTDGSRRTFVFDFKAGLWWPYLQDPFYYYTEEDDVLLGGFTNALYEMFTGTTTQNLALQTIFDDNEQPRNRKDVFTLKITANTGNANVNVYMAKDNGSFVNLGTYAFNGVQEKYIQIATPVGLGIRYQLKIEGTGLTTFELYNFTVEYEPRPEQLNYLHIMPTNQGTVSRKRWITYAFVIDTLGANVTFTPIVDGVSLATSQVNTDRKETYIHYFLVETVGTDTEGILESDDPDNPFEFYQLNLEETISEKIPPSARFMVIPANDYGNPNRKRHSSYKFQINTRGQTIRFTPRIDGVDYAPTEFNTSEKRTVEHFFTTDTIGIDIGGTLESLTSTPFEFYGVIVPQHIEILPPRLREFRIPENNYGIAAKKRVRTMPMVINTNGYDVTFTPIVDQVAQTPSVFNTPSKQTVLHYFTDDQFGIDFSGELTGLMPFEFYGLETPENVETIPVGKRFDQIGPFEMNRLGKLTGFRIEAICTGSSLPYTIYMHDNVVWTGDLVTIPNKHRVYEEIRLPKTIQGTICRIEFGGGSTAVFHRYYVEVRANVLGGKTDQAVLKIGKQFEG